MNFQVFYNAQCFCTCTFFENLFSFVNLVKRAYICVAPLSLSVKRTQLTVLMETWVV